MPDGAGLRWSGAQQAMLRELGCELFVMRGAADVAPAATRDEAPARTGPKPADASTRTTTVARSADDTRDDSSWRNEMPSRGGASERDAFTTAPTARPAPAREAPPVSRPPRNNGAARARLVMLAPDAALLRGPDAAIARALLAALGVHEDEVRGEAAPGVPAIAFGIETTDESVLRAPALAALRDAGAKRALWPALRALRRRLRETRGPRGA